jgi:double-stranded uracil-DNA glycosylase
MARLFGFKPIGAEKPRILVLGSFPSVKSLERGEYYGHGRNQFWAILGLILGFPPESPYADRVAALARSGVALWDVIASCEREGSLDQDIRGETVNPLLEFLAARPSLERLGLNGGKASSSFAAHFAPGLRSSFRAVGGRAEWRPPSSTGAAMLVVRLPSTSPVPTRDFRSVSDKLGPWSAFLS